MTSFGAVDLFSGSNSASGTNKFQVDKNPMNQLDEGVEDVIGQQAQATGGQVTGGFNSVINTVLGSGAAPGPNGGNLNQLASYTQDNLAFNGMQSPASGSGPQSPGTDGFDLFGSIINFVLNLLNPTNLLTPMDPTTQQAYPNNIPPLDASKVTSGQFPQSMLSIVAIPAEIITGVLSAFMMPLVPVSSVGNTNPNLLANPNFTSSVSVSGQGVWTWDGTVTHTADGSGSVSVSCDGTPKALLTDPVIAVSAGQTLACSMWLQWAGVAGAGECFALSIATYLGTNLVATTEIENVSNPAASATWLQLTGSYTIPSSGVDGCRLQLSILPAATAGTVHWDDGVVQKTQLMAESWTAGLPGDLNNLGTGVSANAANLTGSLSGITNFLGGLLNPISGANQTQANAAMQNIYSAVMQNAQALLGITSITKGQNNSGMSATVNFSGYPAGPLPSIFTVNYSGAGTSTIGVDAAGFAHWNAVADANRSAICVFNAETSMSDYQIVGQTLASYTQGGANYILARMSPDGANYVYAKFTATPTFFGLGLEYDVELGCIVAGTKTVWVTPTQVPSPNNNWLVAGTTASGRQFQVISGSQPVVTYLDSANTSQMGSGYRNSGFGGDVVVSGGAAYAPGDAAGWSVADNLPPSVVGSSFRQYRTLTTTVTLSATGYQLLPASFFTNVDYITNDLTLNVTTNALTISIEGTYFIHCRYKINTLAYQCDPAIYKNGVVLKRLGADFGTAAGFYGSAVDGACQAYLKAGDVLQAGAWVQVGSDAILQGEATGEECYWEVSLLNRSTA